MKQDYQGILEEIYHETTPLGGQGRVADYIPALAQVSPAQYGIAIETLDGDSFSVGDATTPFSIQSISKVFLLSMVIRVLGEKLWARVGREPSGTAFNSLVQLETENGIPRNPLINAGALVVSDCLMTIEPQPLRRILEFVRMLANNPQIQYDSLIANSERKFGYRNAALVNFMKSFGNIENDEKEILNLYFHQCALMMNCVDLAHACLFLANEGIHPGVQERILSPRPHSLPPAMQADQCRDANLRIL